VIPLLLASASPRRRELLERVGVPLEIRPVQIDESPLPRERAADYVARLARAKANASRRRTKQWVLAADTTVAIDGEILGKAVTPDEAAAMLRKLSGRIHQVVTGFSIVGDDERLDRAVTSEVVMIGLDEVTVIDYVSCNEWRGKAGAYAIQGIGAALVSAVHGSVTNVAGLPLAEVVAALREAGAPPPRFTAGNPA